MFVKSILPAILLSAAAAAGAQPAPAPSLEQQVLAEINEARADPPAYAAKLKRYREYFEDNIVTLPGSDVGLRTREGVVAVDDAIKFLGRQKPMPPFHPSPPLTEAARQHADDQAQTGATGHTGSDGSDSQARMKKRDAYGFMAETLTYGSSDAVDVVRKLIIDDGDPARSQRKIIFDKKYFRAGVACGPHLRARSVCVINLSTTIGKPAPREARPLPPQVEIR